jgi:hypothetical protein
MAVEKEFSIALSYTIEKPDPGLSGVRGDQRSAKLLSSDSPWLLLAKLHFQDAYHGATALCCKQSMFMQHKTCQRILTLSE